MQYELRKVTIFTGSFGSGKTEITLNFALQLKQAGHQATISDLDIINPYFRTRFVRERLADSGIEVVCPEKGLQSADVPALSPAVRGVMEGNRGYGVIDVGGDDIGSIVLGRFKDILPAGTYNLIMVVNACRPSTRDVEGIIRQVEAIERASRLKINALVNNTNLGPETSLQVIREGQGTVSSAAARIGVTVAFTGVRRDLAVEAVNLGVPVLPLDLFMNPPWLEGGLAGW